MTWGAAQLGIAPGRARRGRGRAHRGERRPARARRRLGRPRGARTRRPCETRTAPRHARHSASASRGAAPPRPPRSSSAVTSSAAPSTAATERCDRRDRDAACTAIRSIRRFARPGIQSPARTRTRRIVVVRSDDGIEGCASGDAAPRPRLLERLLVGLDSDGPSAVHEILETVDFHDGRNWRVEVAVWDLLGRRAASRSGDSSAASGIGSSRTPRAESSSAPTSACVAAWHYATRACGLRRSASTRDDWRVDLPVIEAVREAVGPDMRGHGRRQPGLAHAGRPHSSLGRPDCRGLRERARASGYLLARGAAADRRCRRLRGARAAGTRCGSRPASWCAPPHEARDLVLRGGVDVVQPDVVLVGGMSGARRIAALAERGRAWCPHTWSNGYGLLANLHAALAFSTCPYLEVPFDPPAWSAERRDWLLPADRDRRRRHDRAAARARVSASTPTSRRSSSTGSADADPRRRPARAAHPARDRGGRARPAARRARCWCALPRPASATPTSTSRTETSETGAGRWCSGTRAPASSRRSAPALRTSRRATMSPSASFPPCRPCRTALRAAEPLRAAAEHGVRGMLMDGTRRLRLADGTPLQHVNSPASQSARVVAGRRRGADSRGAAAVAGRAARLRRRHGLRRGAQRGRRRIRRAASA